MKTAIVFLTDGFEECKCLGAGIPFSLKLVEILIDTIRVYGIVYLK